MSSSNKNKKFFPDSIYTIFVISYMVVFIIAFAWLAIQVKSIPSRIAEYDRQIDELVPKHPEAEVITTEGLNETLEKITDPFQMGSSENKIFHHEPRILCTDCQLPIPVETVQARKECPFCKYVPPPPPPPPEDQDLDKDGMWDKWERANGLNPEDAKDAKVDSDKDGFVNLEEFIVRSDPQDVKSSPLGSVLKLEKIVSTKFKLEFMSVSITPKQEKLLGVNVGEKTELVKLGDVLEGYTLKSLGVITLNNAYEGITHTKKVPTLIVEKDGRETTLIKGKPYVEYYAVVMFTLDNSTHTVSSEIPLNIRGRKFLLEKIDSKAKTIALKSADTGKIWAFKMKQE